MAVVQNNSNLLTVKISTANEGILFTYQSPDAKTLGLAYTELKYRFNGLGYYTTTIKDSVGNQLAVLIKQEPAPIDLVIPGVLIKQLVNHYYTQISSWIKGWFQ